MIKQKVFESTLKVKCGRARDEHEFSIVLFHTNAQHTNYDTHTHTNSTIPYVW